MYQRDECIAQASICRKKAQTDPARSVYWIDERSYGIEEPSKPTTEKR
jgi:hypothetical protein